jgi:hypothetical protein
MNKLLVRVALMSTFSFGAGAQQMDLAAMQKWGSAEMVKYHIVGVYQATTFIASDGAGQADVTDRVIIDLDWKMSQQAIVGTPAIQNFKSTTANVRDRAPKCMAPVLKGEYEHYELLSVKMGLGGALDFTSRATYPEVDVQYMCTAGRKPVPAEAKTTQKDFSLPTPVLLAMGVANTEEFSIGPDKASFIVKKDGWTWTIKPTKAGGK